MKPKELPACDVMIESTIDYSDPRPPQSRLPDPEEGRRLLQAFLTIEDPARRSAVIAIVRDFAKSASARVEDGAETTRRRFFLC